MSQEVKLINIKDLVLWTENPREPINPHAKDQDIVNKALEDRASKWTLSKLAKEMGEFYDFSELPTVVYHDKKPVVYDGNRRMILAKLKHGLVEYNGYSAMDIPEIPIQIPCNVCTEDVALKNVYRKHSESGSWQPLERDMFLNKFMKERKSAFLIIEENTHLISNNPHLNQRFVKEEILRDDLLQEMGFDTKSNKLISVHSEEDAIKIFHDISQKVKEKTISTRNNRGRILDILDKSTKKIISSNKSNHYQTLKLDTSLVSFDKIEKTPRQTRRTAAKNTEIFGGKLILRVGDINSLYRDIEDLYNYYLENKKQLSELFPSLIRMSLRLLCEAAAKDTKTNLDGFINKNFSKAKGNLSKEYKTTLSNQNVTESSMIQLLHTGAHNYSSSTNIEQTIAMSIIIGEILKITHEKK